MNYAEKKRMRAMSANTDELVEQTTILHKQREAVMKTAAIMRSILARTKPGKYATSLREAADRMTGIAADITAKIVALWVDGSEEI